MRYPALIEQICVLTNIPMEPGLIAAADFSIDGVNFSLAPGEQEDSAHFFLYCDFGPLPQRQQQTVLEKLLCINFGLLDVTALHFSMNPETRHILLNRSLLFNDADAATVVGLMQEYAQSAHEWREGYFLEQENNSHGGSGSRSGAGAGQPAALRNVLLRNYRNNT